MTDYNFDFTQMSVVDLLKLCKITKQAPCAENFLTILGILGSVTSMNVFVLGPVELEELMKQFSDQLTELLTQALISEQD